MITRFTFRQLEYLAAVGDAGTIALAAQRLNVSSPSISTAISQLETELGIQLFVRHHAQGLSLTPGGRRVFNEVKSILDRAAALNELATEIADKARGPLTVGTLTTVAPYLSAQLRRSFEQQHPDAAVSLRFGNQADLFDMLGRAEIDVALTYDMDLPSDIGFEPVIDLPPYVMLPVDHPMAGHSDVSLAALNAEPLILLDLPVSREYFLSIIQAAGVRPLIGERTHDLAVARSMVANGFGYGLLNIGTRIDRAPDGKALAIRPVREPVPPVQLGLATKQGQQRSGIVQAFCVHVADQIRMHGMPETHVT